MIELEISVMAELIRIKNLYEILWSCGQADYFMGMKLVLGCP